MNVNLALLKLSAAALILASQSGCGGSAGDDDVVPTGGPIASILLVDSDSYHPLDKLRADGSHFEEGDADYGTRNPGHRTGDATTSLWAVDTSAAAPEGRTIEYSMQVGSTTVDGHALRSMQDNLKVDAATGMVYQSCSGYPVCYDNETTAHQDFEITAIAQVQGSSKKLQRTFMLRVIHNN